MKFLAVSAGLIALIGVSSAWGSPPCGTTIAANAALDADITGCSGDGLILDASERAITLDLAGFQISCDDNTTAGRHALRVVGDHTVTVKNGKLSNCHEGLLVDSTKIIIQNVVATQNYNGFYLDAASAGTVSNCVAVSNLNTGLSASSSVSVSNSAAIGNGDHGFTGGKKFTNCRAMNNASDGFFNGSTDPSTYSNNVAGGNGNTGFYVTSNAKLSGNTAAANTTGFGVDSNCKLMKNHATINAAGGFGIVGSGNQLKANSSFGNIGTGVTIEGNANVVKKNISSGNDEAGIRAATGVTGNEIESNTAYGNSEVDGSDQSAACANNTWSNNSFGTKDPACID